LPLHIKRDSYLDCFNAFYEKAGFSKTRGKELRRMAAKKSSSDINNNDCPFCISRPPDLHVRVVLGYLNISGMLPGLVNGGKRHAE
jgi:hypothetical protein